MKVTYEIERIDEFKAWSGAVNTRNAIIKNHNQDEFMFIREDIFLRDVLKLNSMIFYGLTVILFFFALDIQQS